MKKSNLLLLLFLPLVSCSTSTSLTNKRNYNTSTLTNDEICTSVHSFLKGYYELDTVCEIPYTNSGYEYDIKANIVDKVSTSSRYNNYTLDISLDDDSSNLANGEFFYTSDSSGYTIENYISITNEIESREITDTSGDKVEFLGNYNSPFYYLAIKNSDQIATYFDIEEDSGEYSLLLNDAGYALLEDSFNNFFNQYTYKYIANFDSKTHKREIKNVKIVLDSEGVPKTLTFNRVESDYYGAIVEYYTSSLLKLDEVPSLSPVESTLSKEEETYFNEQIENLNTNAFKLGNFTQTVSVTDYTANSDYTALEKETFEYHNYYDPENMIMLSDLALYDSSYGLTYIGTYYYADSLASDSTYTVIGISPDQGFYGALSSSYPTFDSIDEFAPTLSISSDFFTYSYSNSIKTYTFDIESFDYADYYFSLELLEAILGQTDPSVIIGEFVSDSSYNFLFKELTYTFDSENNLSISLKYQGYYGYDCVFTTSYSDIGETNIITVASSNENIQDCLTILKNSD